MKHMYIHEISSPHVQRDATEDDEAAAAADALQAATAAAVLEQQLAGGAVPLATAAFAALADICKAVVKQGGETVPLPQQREQELPLRADGNGSCSALSGIHSGTALSGIYSGTALSGTALSGTVYRG